MKYDRTNKRLEVELVIRTRGYQITVDVPEGTVRLAKAETSGNWQISLRPKEGECAAC